MPSSIPTDRPIYCDPFTNALRNGKIECALTYSYDGLRFNWAFLSALMSWASTVVAVFMSVPCWLMNTIRFVFTPGGSKAEHFQNQDLVDAALMLHTMRLDGTPAGRGILRTRPLRILGDDLRINVKTSYGRVRVRILNESGQTIPGFGFRDCIPLTGDELFWTPRWQGGTDYGRKTPPVGD